MVAFTDVQKRAVPLLASLVVLVSVALAVTLSPWFLVLTVFAAANLLFHSVFGACPAAVLAQRLGVGGGAACAVPQRGDAER